jgi:hypothetical protein
VAVRYSRGERVPNSLELAENSLIGRIVASGLSQGAATLAVVMATRQHARPEGELLDIVRQYPGLENRISAEGALRELRTLGWVITRDSESLSLTMQAPDLRDRIGARLGDPQVPAELLDLRTNLDPNSARVLGPMADGHVYSSYLDLLRSAQSEIFLPMLVTSSRLASVDILRERAQAGVRIKILVGAPHIVASIRGETMRPIAETRIKEWRRNFDDYATVEIRISHKVEDMWLGSCMAIDRRIVRFDIYDPDRQRSLQGIMLELANPQGLDLNLVRIFDELFKVAWLRARPVTLRGMIAWRLAATWKMWIGLLFVVLAFIPTGIQGWIEFTAGMGAAFLSTALIEFGATIRTRRRRRRVR